VVSEVFDCPVDALVVPVDVQRGQHVDVQTAAAGIVAVAQHVAELLVAGRVRLRGLRAFLLAQLPALVIINTAACGSPARTAPARSPAGAPPRC
jgi:hypothetical protein